MKKKIIALLVTLCMVVTLLPQYTIETKAEDTALYVGGVKMQDGYWYKNADLDKASNADGSIHTGNEDDYNVFYSEGILYLKDFAFDGEGYLFEDGNDGEFDSAIIYSEANIEIVLEGTNSISCYSNDVDMNYAVYSPFGDISVSGTGTLEINTRDDGLNTKEGSINIQEIDLNIRTNSGVGVGALQKISILDGASVAIDASTYGLSADNILIDGAEKVDVIARCAINGRSSIVINNCKDVTARSVNNFDGEEALECRIENGISITLDNDCMALVSTQYIGGGAEVYDTNTGSMEAKYKFFQIRTVPEETCIDMLQESGTSKLGESNQLQFNLFEDGAPVAEPSVTWQSSNESIATVDSNGVVRTIAPGQVYITVSYDDGNMVYTGTCQIAVEDEYYTCVGGVTVTSKNRDNLTAAINEAYGVGSASGTIRYTPATESSVAVLTMENATLQGQETLLYNYISNIAIYAEEPLIIQLKGRNAITGNGKVTDTSVAIYGNDELTISGGELYAVSGEFKAKHGETIGIWAPSLRITDSIVTVVGGKIIDAEEGYSAGINVWYEVVVENSTLRTEGTSGENIASIGIFAGDLVIDNSTVTAQGQTRAIGISYQPQFIYENGYQWKHTVAGELVSSADTEYVFDENNLDTYLHIRPSATAVLSYAANDGSNVVSEVGGIALSEEYVIRNDVFTREGYILKGWNTQADGKGNAYAAGAKITLTEDVTLYAQWEEIQKKDDNNEQTKEQPKKQSKVTVKKTAIKKVKAKKRTLTIKWKKISGVTGYEVQVALKKNFKKGLKTKIVKKAKKTKVTFKKLRAKKKYFVRVRAYKKVNGVKYTSKWSTVKKKKTK